MSPVVACRVAGHSPQTAPAWAGHQQGHLSSCSVAASGRGDGKPGGQEVQLWHSFACSRAAGCREAPAAQEALKSELG